MPYVLFIFSILLALPFKQDASYTGMKPPVHVDFDAAPGNRPQNALGWHSFGVTAAPDTTSQEVLFATNEDCLLYIFREFNGVVLKSTHRYINLKPGVYEYKARSSRTLDELRGQFIVTKSGLNEVFLDMLYVVDEKARQAHDTGSTVKRALSPVPKTSRTPPKKGGVATIKSKDLQEASINALVSNMVFINGGNFVMGNNRAPSKDEVEHPVTIKSIHFGKYEVTQEQWTSIMDYNPSSNKGCSNCPVENVSWEEVMKFIRKLNVISDIRFRLPTEAEWEYVAKIGGKAELDAAGGPEAYIKKSAWYFANAGKQTHPVGDKQPNISKIYDLYGNVSEWCMDWYDSDYYRDTDNSKNPDGPPLGNEKVVRGGSFSDYLGDNFRPSLRFKLKPTTKSPDVGFRLVMEVR